MQNRLSKFFASDVRPSYSRSLRLFLFSMSLQTFGHAGLIVYTNLYVYWISGSLLDLALFNTIPQAVLVASGLVWGYYSDKTQRRQLSVLIGTIGYTVLAFSLTILRDPLSILIATSLGNASYAAVFPLSQAYATSISQKPGKALSNVIASRSIGWFLGSTILGVLLEDTGSMPLVFMVSGIALLVSLIPLIFVKDVKHLEKTKTPEHGKPQESEKSGYLVLIVKKVILVLCVVDLLHITGMSMFQSFFPVYYVEGLGGGEAFFGLFSGVATVPGMFIVLLFGVLVDRPKIGRKPIFLYSLITSTVVFLMLMFVRDPILVGLVWAIPIYPGTVISGPALITDYTKKHDRGRGMSLLSGFESLGRVLGPAGAAIIILVLTLAGGQNIVQVGLLIILYSFIINAVGLALIVLGIPRSMPNSNTSS